MELLVVISIIAVLAGILMPALGKIQVSARTVQCQSNLRQIGAAMLAHAGEHDGYLPTGGGYVAYKSTDPTTGLPGWTQQLEPYVGTNRDIFICPASHYLLPTNVQYGYFMSCRAAYVDHDNQFAPVRLSKAQALSKLLLAGDVVSNTVYPNQGATDADKNDAMINPGFATMTKVFHGKKTNLVFADGHIGAFPKFDSTQMTVRYGLKPDGTGYGYSDQ